MNIQESLNKLFALHTFGIKLGLDNIQKFLNKIGNPQSKLKTIHIAGSNGKGSTCIIYCKYPHGKWMQSWIVHLTSFCKV